MREFNFSSGQMFERRLLENLIKKNRLYEAVKRFSFKKDEVFKHFNAWINSVRLE